jgi:hypothetical protein
MKLINKIKVGDSTMTWKIKDNKIIITNRYWRTTIWSYEVLISKWWELNNAVWNPNSNKKRFITELNKETFPSNYIELEEHCFIDRIEDAQILVINNLYSNFIENDKQ